MVFRQQLFHTPAVAASYVLGCAGQSAGAVVDPIGDPSEYVRIADELGVKVRYVVDTHVHADHISSGRDLAAITGAAYVLHRSVEAAFPFHGVGDDSELVLGNVSLRVMHTPGHTPEHISLLVIDRSRSTEPWAALTGHTLMVGDMGRTELASELRAGASALFKSSALLKALPDHVEVWPGAFSGSVCGRGLSGKPSSTIGFERAHNRAFRIDSHQEFLALMERDVPPPPPEAAATRSRNLGHI